MLIIFGLEIEKKRISELGCKYNLNGKEAEETYLIARVSELILGFVFDIWLLGVIGAWAKGDPGIREKEFNVV